MRKFKLILAAALCVALLSVTCYAQEAGGPLVINGSSETGEQEKSSSEEKKSEQPARMLEGSDISEAEAPKKENKPPVVQTSSSKKTGKATETNKGVRVTMDKQSDEKQSEDEAVVAQAKAKKSMTPEQKILNSASLSPSRSDSPEVRRLVRGVLNDVTTPEMDTYEALWASYDYLLDSMTYSWTQNYMSGSIDGVTFNSIYNNYGEIDGVGAVALAVKKGECSSYASAFILLAEQLGLDGRLVQGVTRNGGGGYAYHKWAEFDINGTTYLFDPQLGQSLIKYGFPEDAVFCKTYAQVPGRYKKY